MLSASLLLGGCLGGSPGEPAEPTSQAPSTNGSSPAAGNPSGPNASSTTAGASGLAVYNLTTHFTAEAYNSGLEDAATGGDERAIEVPVPAGATGLIAEARWTGAADVDLNVASPAMCSHATTDGDRRLCEVGFLLTGEEEGGHSTDRTDPRLEAASIRLAIDAGTIEAENCEDPPCAWWVSVHPNIAADATVDLRVSVFTGTAPPDGYSAFDAPGS